MLRPTPSAFARTSLQLSHAAGAPRAAALGSRAIPGSRRWASGSAPNIKYGFRGSLLRWGLAIGGVYWYATQGSKVLAEEPAYIPPFTLPQEREDASLLTVDQLHAARKARTSAPPPPPPTSSPSVAAAGADAATGGLAGGVADLEGEADSQGAFNPETGEINWDCPCLGGMAHGPCGPEFRAAFSCFVHSTDEPKGMDCVDRFRGMQDCFRLHPDVYGAELEGDDDEPADELDAGAAAAVSPERAAVAADAIPKAATKDAKAEETAKAEAKPATGGPHELSSSKLNKENSVDQSADLVPKPWHDTRDANEQK